MQAIIRAIALSYPNVLRLRAGLTLFCCAALSAPSAHAQNAKASVPTPAPSAAKSAAPDATVSAAPAATVSAAQPAVTGPAANAKAAPLPALLSPAPVGSSSASFIPGAMVGDEGNSVNEGPVIANYESELKKVFPEADSFRESDLLPLQSGGTSFTGLVARLLGEGCDRNFEGLRTRRHMYQAFRKDKPVGIAHGSSINIEGREVAVYVYYSTGGTLRKVSVAGASDSLTKRLESGGLLKQFENFTTEDFEMIRGKRHRLKSKGAFFTKVRHPGPEVRQAFEKIVRAVRYNAAFMDVAYFITQHPDMADKPVQNFPDEVEVTTGVPVSGPEAYVNGQRITVRTPASVLARPLVTRRARVALEDSEAPRKHKKRRKHPATN